MNLIQIQMDAIRRDHLDKFRSKRPIWSKKRRRTFSIDPFDYYDRPDREDTREFERDYPSPYDEPEERGDPEYPFQEFNYGP